MKMKRYLHNFIEIILKDPERKNLFRIIHEVLILFWKDKVFPVHYFSRDLYKKGHNDLYSYVNNRILYSLASIFNDQQLVYYLDNKLFFHYFCSYHQLPVPVLLACNQGSVFINGEKTNIIRSAAEFSDLMKELLSERSKTGVIFMKRSYGTYGGSNIYRITTDDLYDKNLIHELFLETQEADYIFQDKVLQHPSLDRLNPSSVNTQRIVTFCDKQGQTDIISATLRMGMGNSYVDNISSGGCGIRINTETGRMTGDAYSSITEAGGKNLTAHPQTGIVFRDYPLPFFQESKELVLKAAQLLPFIRLIGWDIAITSEGPIFIEGNDDCDMTGPDKLTKGLKNNAVFRKLLEEYNNKQK